MNGKTLAIIIPNYNGLSLLETYLPSVLEAARRAGARVVVADDGSSDPSVSWLREHAPEAEVIESERNLGFVGNVNRAVRAVSADIVILLNSDVDADPDFIRPLIEHFSDPAVFAVSPSIRSMGHEGRDEGVVHFAFEHGLIRCKVPCLHGASPPAGAAPIGWPCGGAGAFDRAKFLELGLFDELYAPNYFEDVDLGYRAWKRGWRVVYEPAGVVRHQHSATMRRYFSAGRIRRWWTERTIWFTWKILSDRGLLLRHAAWMARLPLSYLRHGQWPELAGWFGAWARLGAAFRARKRVTAGLTDAEVMRVSNPWGGPPPEGPGLPPLRARVMKVFQAQGLSGVLAKAGRRLAAEFAGARLQRRGRDGPVRLDENRGRPIEPGGVRRVAVVMLRGLGDALVATPGLAMMKERFREARFTLVGSAGTARVFAGAGVFDDEVILPADALDISQGPPRSFYEALERLRSLSPDLIYLAYPTRLTRLSEVLDRLGARFVVGSEDDGPWSMMTHRVGVPAERHFAEINADLARAAGCSGPTPPLQLWLQPEERAAARAWVEKHCPRRPRVGMHVATLPETWQRRWPAAYFAELADRLEAKRGARIILLTGPSDREAAQEVIALMRTPPVVAGDELSLRETMALIERLDLLVSTDSVWMHVAAAARTPVAAMFGPTPSAWYRPFTDPGAARFFVSPADCVPCWEKGKMIACPDGHCMRQISVDEVERAAEELIRGAEH